MKVYITSRFKQEQDHHEIEDLSIAVRKAGLKDFSFVRDVEQDAATFDDPKRLWARAYDEISACDALLIDVGDHPTGGRLVEAGIAYALRKPVIVVKREGIRHKSLFDGISETLITYKDYDDLAKQLKPFEKNRAFNVTDKTTLFIMFLAVGAASSWFLSQLFIPLGLIWAVIYWIVVRVLVAPMRAFDRIVIFVPLAAVWVAVYGILEPAYLPLALAWAVIYWIVTLALLKRLKFSL